MKSEFSPEQSRLDGSSRIAHSASQNNEHLKTRRLEIQNSQGAGGHHGQHNGVPGQRRAKDFQYQKLSTLDVNIWIREGLIE